MLRQNKTLGFKYLLNMHDSSLALKISNLFIVISNLYKQNNILKILYVDEIQGATKSVSEVRHSCKKNVLIFIRKHKFKKVEYDKMLTYFSERFNKMFILGVCDIWSFKFLQ